MVVASSSNPDAPIKPTLALHADARFIWIAIRKVAYAGKYYIIRHEAGYMGPLVRTRRVPTRRPPRYQLSPLWMFRDAATR
jgi:hypothetical protein